MAPGNRRNAMGNWAGEREDLESNGVYEYKNRRDTRGGTQSGDGSFQKWKIDLFGPKEQRFRAPARWHGMGRFTIRYAVFGGSEMGGRHFVSPFDMYESSMGHNSEIGDRNVETSFG